MPRLRRAARQRRQKPQLAAEIWEWLCGRKSYDELAVATKFELLILEGPAVNQWNPPDGPPDRVEQFWERVRQAVEEGKIEVSATKEHFAWDQPLI